MATGGSGFTLRDTIKAKINGIFVGYNKMFINFGITDFGKLMKEDGGTIGINSLNRYINDRYDYPGIIHVFLSKNNGNGNDFYNDLDTNHASFISDSSYSENGLYPIYDHYNSQWIKNEWFTQSHMEHGGVSMITHGSGNEKNIFKTDQRILDYHYVNSDTYIIQNSNASCGYLVNINGKDYSTWGYNMGCFFDIESINRTNLKCEYVSDGKFEYSDKKDETFRSKEINPYSSFKEQELGFYILLIRGGDVIPDNPTQSSTPICYCSDWIPIEQDISFMKFKNPYIRTLSTYENERTKLIGNQNDYTNSIILPTINQKEKDIYGVENKYKKVIVQFQNEPPYSIFGNDEYPNTTYVSDILQKIIKENKLSDRAIAFESDYIDYKLKDQKKGISNSFSVDEFSTGTSFPFAAIMEMDVYAYIQGIEIYTETGDNKNILFKKEIDNREFKTDYLPEHYTFLNTEDNDYYYDRDYNHQVQKEYNNLHANLWKGCYMISGKPEDVEFRKTLHPEAFIRTQSFNNTLSFLSDKMNSYGSLKNWDNVIEETYDNLIKEYNPSSYPAYKLFMKNREDAFGFDISDDLYEWIKEDKERLMNMVKSGNYYAKNNSRYKRTDITSFYDPSLYYNEGKSAFSDLKYSIKYCLFSIRDRNLSSLSKEDVDIDYKLDIENPYKVDAPFNEAAIKIIKDTETITHNCLDGWNDYTSDYFFNIKLGNIDEFRPILDESWFKLKDGLHGNYLGPNYIVKCDPEFNLKHKTPFIPTEYECDVHGLNLLQLDIDIDKAKSKGIQYFELKRIYDCGQYDGLTSLYPDDPMSSQIDSGKIRLYESIDDENAGIKTYDICNNINIDKSELTITYYDEYDFFNYIKYTYPSQVLAENNERVKQWPFAVINYKKPIIDLMEINRVNVIDKYIYINSQGSLTSLQTFDVPEITNDIKKIKYRYKETSQGDDQWSEWVEDIITQHIEYSEENVKYVIENENFDTIFNEEKQYNIEIKVEDSFGIESEMVADIINTADVYIWKDLKQRYIGINKKPEHVLDIKGDANFDVLYIDGKKMLWYEDVAEAASINLNDLEDIPEAKYTEIKEEDNNEKTNV